jgi:sortase A
LVVVLAGMLALAACGGGGQGESGNAPQQDAAPREEAPKQEPDPAPPSTEENGGGGEEEASVDAPEDDTLTLTVPKMERVKNVAIPNAEGDDSEALKGNAAIHLDGTGYPWQKEANVYLAGHRLGYPNTNSYLAFYDIDKLENGDEVLLTDANGKEYRYEVFNELTVDPTDVYVIDPIEGKNIVSLQACTLPDYSRRIIVQAELVES